MSVIRCPGAALRVFVVFVLLGALLGALLISGTATGTIFGRQPVEGRSAATPGFQPSAPYYATFFYPWYRNAATDGTWAGSYWEDNGHAPPANWFSRYLPDVDPTVFDPVTELYSSTDDAILYWQLSKLAEARQEVAISSWWGQDHKTDSALRHILDVMKRPGNPYPNLRWSIYYEKEGFGDPSVAEITGDLRYLAASLSSQPAYFRIDDKPVVFVYGDATDGQATLDRWARARAEAGVNIYLVLKVFPDYVLASSQPDSWHQYAPAVRTDRQSGHSMLVSPGFWKDGEAVRLPRDVDEFSRAVREMVVAPVQWKLTETWNEWGEGTSVEPGTDVNQTTSGPATIRTDAAEFGNRYVDVLATWLPALERGTGARR